MARSVLVRGFDFGTSEDQIGGHMSSVGTIESIQWVDDGSVSVSYSTAMEAKFAVAQLNQSNIPGNRRYLDVLLMDPQGFLAGHNIDADKVQQFNALPPDQQMAIIKKGSLSSARDPTAVLVGRMKQVRADASAKPFTPPPAMAAAGSSFGGSCSVLVRGFDFGTSEDMITSHMSQVGSIESVHMIDGGSACVIYSSTEEAKAAVANLQQTNIPGNRRYLDVLIMDPQEFLNGHNIDMDKAQQFYALTPEQQQSVMVGGSLSTARDPTAVLVKRMKQAKGGPSANGFNPAAAAMGGFGGSSSNSVLVRGFDFGTTQEQITAHMSTAGTVLSVQWVDDGSVSVTYTSADEAKVAAEHLQQSNIPGNRRYLDVILMDPQGFLAGHNIDMDKAQQFYAMTLQQQQAVIQKGSLSSARDPTAVLVQRMQQAKGVGKGSFGPAKGGGGGMAGGMASGPYGGGGMGKGGGGGDNVSAMMDMMKGMMAQMMAMQAQNMGGGNWGGGKGGGSW